LLFVLFSKLFYLNDGLISGNICLELTNVVFSFYDTFDLDRKHHTFDDDRKIDDDRKHHTFDDDRKHHTFDNNVDK
jgi:hypothetical protein